jgi:hypothetical protein
MSATKESSTFVWTVELTEEERVLLAGVIHAERFRIHDQAYGVRKNRALQQRRVAESEMLRKWENELVFREKWPPSPS